MRIELRMPSFHSKNLNPLSHLVHPGFLESSASQRTVSWAWWCVLALGRQDKKNLCEFKANLINILNSRTAQTTQRDPVSKERQKDKDVFHGPF